MNHLKDYNAARQEALEEAGLRGRMKRLAIGRFSYSKLYADGSPKLLSVDVFALEVTAVLQMWPEKSQRQRRWFKAQDAAALVNEIELKNLILKFATLPAP